MFKVETGIPISDGRGRKAKYPWSDVKVGDSFFAPINHTVLRAAARHQKTRRGLTFVVRKDGEGARAWRTA